MGLGSDSEESHKSCEYKHNSVTTMLEGRAGKSHNTCSLVSPAESFSERPCIIIILMVIVIIIIINSKEAIEEGFHLQLLTSTCAARANRFKHTCEYLSISHTGTQVPV